MKDRRAASLMASGRLCFAAIAVLLVVAPARADATGRPALRRMALIAGANDGGPKRAKLRFATEDAKSMFRVLRDLGGVLPEDSILLTDPDERGLEQGFDALRRRLDAARGQAERLEILFYFSGHSDEQGILLGGERLAYSRIRELVDGLPADVKLAIVDSCASGAMTREKGGVRRPPFLLDASTDVKGVAILTSSSEDEAAQESDKVGGSFFTHFLVSGLRGAADTTRDDRVTLNEAYAYAFHETLARTESTKAGPQHAAYDFQLSGSGDLVLTDLHGTSALVQIDAALVGRLFIRGKDGALVAEVNKPAGRPMSLGLEPGDYKISLQAADGWYGGSIRLAEGKTTPLTMSNLKRSASEATTARGDEPSPPEPIRHRPVSMGLFPGVTTDGGAEGRVRNNFSLNLIGWGDDLYGFELSSIGAIRHGMVKGLQISGVFDFTKESSSGVVIGGVTNIAGGSSYGLDISGVASVARGDSIGQQVGGVATWSGGRAIGLHIGGVASLTRGESIGQQVGGAVTWSGGKAIGLHIGGVASAAGGDSKGVFVAGVAHVTRGAAIGLALSGVADVATGPVDGLQIGGVSAYAGSLQGLQIGGVASVAREEMRGLQVGGVVNVCGSCKGAQIGVVNIATKSFKGAQVGLVNYAADGRLAFTYWGSETALVNVGMKLGSRHMYGILGLSLDPLGERWSGYFAGLGGHAELSRGLWLEVDAISFALNPTDDWSQDEIDMLVQARGVLGWRCLEQMSIFGGLALNNLVSERRDHVGLDWSMSSSDDGDLHYRMSLGFLLGVQWEPRWGSLNR
jgi:hypothetical protein